MAQRILLDSNLVGYWGLDEALETDVALDSTANALTLTVTNASGTAPGRVGNSRQLNGASSFASVSDAKLRLTGDLTLMAWVKLSSYNGAGSQLRSILSCGGPLTGDNTLYALNVTLFGALQYRHTSAAGEVVVQTANGVIKTNQFYMVQVRRTANGANQDVEIYVDNVIQTLAVVTVNGTAQAQPVPPPAANAAAVFSLGRSQKETNSAFWDGFLDEVSVHDISRPFQPYLIEAYYRNALLATTTKLTATNTVVRTSSYEMGAGVRWWCIERDKDLYVVKESPFGNFGPETRLTTVGGGNSSLAGSPELIYDAGSDTLYVFFVAGNRIYKLSANSTDDPATINMPFTADTGNIIKSVDNVDGGRLGEGGAGNREVLRTDFTQNGFFPIKLLSQDTGTLGEGGAGQTRPDPLENPLTGLLKAASIAFMQHPTLGFGVVIGPVDNKTGGYVLYTYAGNSAVPLSSPISIDSNRYFVAIPTRVYGQVYVAESKFKDGKLSGFYSNIIIDRFTEAELTVLGNWSLGVLSPNDAQDSGSLGEGGQGLREVLQQEMVYVNRTPLKLSLQDPVISDLGEGGQGQSGFVTNGSTGGWTRPEMLQYAGKTIYL